MNLSPSSKSSIGGRGFSGAARLTIDLDALAANHAAICAKVRGAEVAPVLKADAYGIGAKRVGRRLWSQGARCFLVARVAEGLELRAALGPERPATIQVLDGCPPGSEDALRRAALTPVLNSLDQVAAWSAQAAREARALEAALHVDTGMNRLGLRPEEVEALAAAPDRLRGIELTLIMSHLARAEDLTDPFSERQAERLAKVRRLFPDVPGSLASSGGIWRGPAFQLDLVRPGISLYGGGPLGRPDPDIAAVAHVHAPVLQVRSVPPGESVGYGRAFVADRATRLAIVSAGYADGVLRSAGTSGYGWFEGARLPYVGRVSMDLIALDVGDADVQPGGEVELLGAHVLVDDLAARAGTTALEFLTRLSPRLARTYLGEVP